MTALVVLLLFASLLAGWPGEHFIAPARAQTYSLDPLGTAVPVDERPAGLRGARDLVNDGTRGLRLRAEVWVRIAPCPDRRPSERCSMPRETQGRVFIGPVWDDRPIAELEVEELWLLHKSGVWSTRQLRRTAEGQLEFDGAPALPAGTPADVVVKIRGIAEPLQIRYRMLYARGS